MTIVAYIRVSTEKQAEHGHSLKDQQHKIAAYAGLSGFKISEWLFETASGADENREKINYILSLAEEGKINKLIVTKIDRLARDVVLGKTIIKKLRSLGVEVISIDDNFDNSPMGNFMNTIIFAFSEFERSQISLRTHPAKKRMIARTGRFWGGTASYGYSTKGSNKTGINAHGELLINEKEKQFIKRIYELKSQFSGKEITNILNKEGYTNRAGNPVQPMTICRILKRESLYKGTTHINKSITLDQNIKPAHPKIFVD